MESDVTDISTSSVPHQLVYIRICADNKRVVTLMIHTLKRFTQLKYKCLRLLCPCSRCVQRGHKMHQTSSKQCRPTLSMAFISNVRTNLVPCFNVKSTGSHEVLNHGQLTKISCKV